MSENIPPHFAHQNDSVKFMEDHDRVLDASDPGTGKTRVQIETFARRRRNKGKAALIIAPKSLLRSAWEDDFRKFAPGITVSVATANNREKAFGVPADVYVTNTDAVRWLVGQKPAFFERFDTLIVDEMSAFKHATSARSKALNKIKKYFKYRRGLTGTPNSNGITDIWNQIFVLDDGQRLGKSFYQFRNSVQTPKQVGPSPSMVAWEDKPGAEIAVGSLLQDIVVRHKFEECIDIPKNFEYSVPYHLTKGQMAVYKAMERDAIAMLGNGRIISTVNAAGVMNKLLQIASGASYSDEGSGQTQFIAAVADKLGYAPISTERYELVGELVEQREHSVVFFNWRHQRDELVKEFESRGFSYVVIDGNTTDKERKDAVDGFQNGFYKVLLAHPQSAAHGLTLTRGTATIWASPTYNLEHWLQGNRRIYRAGQKNKTETIVVMAPETIEERVFEKLVTKNAKQTTMLDFLQQLFDDQR